MNRIYLDYNATTPLDGQVREAMSPFLGAVFGNPSSIHYYGRQARAELDQAHERLAKVLGCNPGELIFTSGGTEGNNLTIQGVARHRKNKGRHLITSAIEHHSVLAGFEYLAAQEGFELTLLPVDEEGVVCPDDLAKAIRPDTILVSVMAANNETGTLEPVRELGAICRERGVIFHTDAAQWLGKLPLESIHDFQADLMTLCAHKFHGPKGAGALYVRSGAILQPQMLGGGQENERRAGTENLAGIIGLVEASERFLRTPVFEDAHLRPLTEHLRNYLKSDEKVTIRGSESRCLNNTVSFTVEGVDSLTLLAMLDLEGICVSSGSACTAGSLQPSHVLSAMGVKNAGNQGFMRFSLGRENCLAEVEQVEGILDRVLRQCITAR